MHEVVSRARVDAELLLEQLLAAVRERPVAGDVPVRDRLGDEVELVPEQARPVERDPQLGHRVVPLVEPEVERLDGEPGALEDAQRGDVASLRDDASSVERRARRTSRPQRSTRSTPSPRPRADSSTAISPIEPRPARRAWQET